MSKPRVEDHIVGLRQWQVIDFAGLPEEAVIKKMRLFIAKCKKPQLGSITGRSAWTPGEWKTAECEIYTAGVRAQNGYHYRSMGSAPPRNVFMNANAHRAPDRAHECGCYAYHPDGIQGGIGEPSAPYVWGVVQAKGKVCVHHDGFRAEHARMVAVIARPTPFWALMAECMGVDLLLHEDVQNGWKPYGTMVDPAYRPEPTSAISSMRVPLGQGYRGLSWHGTWSTQGWGPPLSPGQRATQVAYGKGGYYGQRSTHLSTLAQARSSVDERAAALRKMRSERETAANAMRDDLGKQRDKQRITLLKFCKKLGF